MNKLIARIKGFLLPTDLWVCHYWRMDDPERVAETFPTQVLARECEQKRSAEGYIALVRFEGTTPNHMSAVLGAVQAIAGVLSSGSGSSSGSKKSNG